LGSVSHTRTCMLESKHGRQRIRRLGFQERRFQMPALSLLRAKMCANTSGNRAHWSHARVDASGTDCDCARTGVPTFCGSAKPDRRRQSRTLDHRSGAAHGRPEDRRLRGASAREPGCAWQAHPGAAEQPATPGLLRSTRHPTPPLSTARPPPSTPPASQPRTAPALTPLVLKALRARDKKIRSHRSD